MVVPLPPFMIILLSCPIMVLAQAPSAYSTSLRNCSSTCGNVSIPFPFGIGDDCSIDTWLTVECRSGKPYLRSIHMEVFDISLDGVIRVNYPVYNSCNSSKYLDSIVSFEKIPFIFSQMRNTFIGVGCANFSFMSSDDSPMAKCTATCDHNGNPGENSFCQEKVVSSLKRYLPYIEAPTQQCNYAVLVEERWWVDNLKNPLHIKSYTHVPVVLEWSVFGMSFNYFARNKSRSIYESTSSCELSACSCFSSEYPTVRCNCLPGFEGNPYLLEGCADIDECATHTNICGSGKCENFIGGYTCHSSQPPHESSENSHVTMIMLGTSTSFGSLILFVGVWWLYTIIKKRRAIRLKQEFFKKNGGLLLQQQLTSFGGGVERSKLFNSEELNKATNNFNMNRILGQGGQGTVYKGMLEDGRIVAVKKSKIIDEGKIEEFINEVVILSQINHRNVVKLLGCCLETEVPLLVYEFISNGTLFQYIHEQNEELPLTWGMRLQIAAEVAAALSYLHSAACLPIYHRDIKSSNILLDDKYRVKVADFGTSKSIAIDQTHVTTKVQGTFGYLDPEYFQSSQFTDKSDVYSFGVVIVELLTGQKPISLTRSEDHRSLVIYFILSMEDNFLFDILDAHVKLGKKEEIMQVAHLAKRCLNLSGKQRPTMKEVVAELEAIQVSQMDSKLHQNHEEVEIEVIESWDVTSTGSIFDSTAPLLDVEPLTKKSI